MSRHFRLTQRARQDLDDIWAHIGSDNLTAADVMIDQFYEKCRQLIAYPLLGRPRDDLVPGLRSLLLRPYLIFYKPVQDSVEIWRILHGARNITGDSFRRP